MNLNKEQAVSLVDEWARNFRPPDVLLTEENVTKVFEKCLALYDGVSISYMIAACTACINDGLLSLVPPPKVKTPEQIAADGNAKMQKEYQDSLKPQPSFDARVKAETAKRQAADAAKTQERAKGELRTTIDAYECYKTNGSGKDFPSTEMIRRELTAVISRNADGTRDFVRNLVVVKQIIQELQDHPVSGDVARALAAIHARLK
jgi:hypothetical protein